MEFNDRLQIEDDRAVSCADFPIINSEGGGNTNIPGALNFSRDALTRHFSPAAVLDELNTAVSSFERGKCLLQKGEGRGFAYLQVLGKNAGLFIAFYTNGSVWARIESSREFIYSDIYALLKDFDLSSSAEVPFQSRKEQLPGGRGTEGAGWVKLPLDLAVLDKEQRSLLWEKIRRIISLFLEDGPGV